MTRKLLGIFMVFSVMMVFFACENDTHDSNDTFSDEKADDEADNEKNLTKGDLSGCLGDGYEEYSPVPVKVILDEKSEKMISFHYQDSFYCAGNDFYYQITPDETDETLLHVYLKALNTMDGSVPGCGCPMRIGVEFASEDQDLTKIEKIKIEYDFYWNEEKEDQVFLFEKMNCFYKGKVYEEGDSLTDWCNLCGCSKDGGVACNEVECSFCEKEATMEYSCGDEKEIIWCECPDPEKGWDCIEDPVAICEED